MKSICLSGLCVISKTQKIFSEMTAPCKKCSAALIGYVECNKLHSIVEPPFCDEVKIAWIYTSTPNTFS